MSHFVEFSALLDHCGDIWLQFIDLLAVNTLIEGISACENAKYSVTKIRNILQDKLNLNDIMSGESIEKRFQIICQEYKTQCEPYFRYFQTVSKESVLLRKYDKDKAGSSLIQYILRHKYLLNEETMLHFTNTAANNYDTGRYSCEDLLNIKSNQVMRFEHKRLINWEEEWNLQRKESAARKYADRGIELTEEGCPKFYQYDVQFGYLSSNSFENCTIFLLEKSKELNYGNEARAKSASFILSRLLLANIFQPETCCVVFNRLDQTGYVHSYPYRVCTMELYSVYWILKADSSFVLSLQL